MSRLDVEVAAGVTVSVLARGQAGALTPMLLVHGLASNARLWDWVADDLAERGHPVAAVDQRGHGRSSKPDDGYDFETLTNDLVRVVHDLGWSERPPVVAGQSWGGNVVLELAARHPSITKAIALVDGGTIELSSRFADWPTCEAAMAPPRLAGTPADQFEKLIRTHHPDWPEAGIQGTLANMEVLPDRTIRPWLSRDHHLTILRHLWEHRPSHTYPSVSVPVLMLMADDPSNPRWMAGKRDEVARAANLLPRSDVRWIQGDHDLHAEHPGLVADHLHALAEDGISLAGAGLGAGGGRQGVGGQGVGGQGVSRLGVNPQAVNPPVGQGVSRLGVNPQAVNPPVGQGVSRQGIGPPVGQGGGS